LLGEPKPKETANRETTPSEISSSQPKGIKIKKVKDQGSAAKRYKPDDDIIQSPTRQVQEKSQESEEDEPELQNVNAFENI